MKSPSNEKDKVWKNVLKDINYFIIKFVGFPRYLHLQTGQSVGNILKQDLTNAFWVPETV